jgi:hypothetical protein
MVDLATQTSGRGADVSLQKQRTIPMIDAQL